MKKLKKIFKNINLKDKLVWNRISILKEVVLQKIKLSQVTKDDLVKSQHKVLKNTKIKYKLVRKILIKDLFKKVELEILELSKVLKKDWKFKID